MPALTLRNKETERFEKTYVTWFPRMKRFAVEFLMSEEDAENVVQDVFTELWERREVLTYDVNIISILFTSIKNRCIDLLRHRVVVKHAEEVMQEEFQRTLRMKLDSLELLDQSLFSSSSIENIITEAINTLPERCRLIFIKSKIEGMKQQEIAADLQISPKTVENQLQIACRKLRVLLKDYLPLFLFLC